MSATALLGALFSSKKFPSLLSLFHMWVDSLQSEIDDMIFTDLCFGLPVDPTLRLVVSTPFANHLDMPRADERNQVRVEISFAYYIVT